MKRQIAVVNFVANFPTNDELKNTPLFKSLQRRGIPTYLPAYIRMYDKLIVGCIADWAVPDYPIKHVDDPDGKYILEFAVYRSLRDDYARLWSALKFKLFGSAITWDLWPQ